jgi:hypothetical protein
VSVWHEGQYSEEVIEGITRGRIDAIEEAIIMVKRSITTAMSIFVLILPPI